MKRVQHEKGAALKRVQNEATRENVKHEKRFYMKKVQHEESAT